MVPPLNLKIIPGPHWMELKYPVLLSLIVGVSCAFIQNYYVKTTRDFFPTGMDNKYAGYAGYVVPAFTLDITWFSAQAFSRLDFSDLQEPFAIHRLLGFFPYYVLGMVVKHKKLTGGRQGT